MLVLGFDTATAACTVALVAADGLLAELTVMGQRAHSTRLMPLVSQALREAGRDPAALDGVAVGVGPGSFTGLRIGLATAKGLAYALGRPVAGVCTLAAMAWALGPGPGLAVPLVDAKRGQVFAAAYRCGSGEPVAELAPSLLPVDELAARLAGITGPVTVLGDGAPSHWQRLAAAMPRAAVALAPPGLLLPRGWAVADLGRSILLRGAGVAPPALAPLYLKPAEAEVLWARRHGEG